MAYNTTKKILLTGVFALSAAFVLASCDNISAMPANYETPIVMKGGVAYEDEENKLGEIYDAISSNKSDKVVSTLLEKLAEKEFGTYEEIEACFTVSGDESSMDEAKAKAHIAKYKHEFVKSDDKMVAIVKGVTPEFVQLARFKNFYKDINERINAVVFGEISSDSYRDTINKTEFLEEKYARAKREASYDIKGFDEVGATWKDVFIDDDFQEDNVRDYLTDFTVRYKDYIVRKIIPSVYKDKLVEEYILENNYSALGRAYGRKINFVKVAYTEEDPNTTYKLVESFAKTLKTNVSAEPVDYSKLVDWVKGFSGITTNTVDGVKYPAIKPLATSDALTAIYGEPVSISPKCEKEPGKVITVDLKNYGFAADFKYYEKTKLGEILKNFEKAAVGEATRFASSDDVAQFNDFTNNGKRSKEQGLMEKITKLALEDYAENGWYVKNDKSGSLSSMPDSIKNRIFNIKVSNDFDKADWKYVRNESYFGRFAGQNHSYLTMAGSDTFDVRDMILRDTSGKALYIVEILEAPSTSKLNKISDKSYLFNHGNPFKTEEVARQIAKMLGTKDTYTTNAYTSYLELYTFTYHDTSVYDYLKATYPDLFEDD